MWVSAEPVSDPARLWMQYQRQQPATGLRPLLFYPDGEPSPLDPARLAHVDLEHVLERAWQDYRQQQLQ
ncbi:hypothetical protein [Streptomyces sp. MZ04]|uniref:hypothetical protein n=1 Tax=Streptomyces sp. MZ04 TaxID=2559236 RepID=UPI00107ECD39|nr:hypothetical protein [Streptomyces sp. MZ04]TGA90937.1 hypothetical protein E2651_38220 [Streptomyces sp. MZ04]